MIELTELPDKYINLQDGDHVLVNGIECVVTVRRRERFLTTHDSCTLDEYELLHKLNGPAHRGYDYYWRHVRVNGSAIVDDELMISALKNKTFTIL